MSNLEEGVAVRYSGVGSGKITGFSERGYPQVNGVTVAVLELEDGTIFNPHSANMEELRRLSEQYDHEHPKRAPMPVAVTRENAEELVSTAFHNMAQACDLRTHLLQKCSELGIPEPGDDPEQALEDYVQHRIRLYVEGCSSDAP